MKKICPYIKKECMEGQCTMWIEMMFNENGNMKKSYACSIPLAAELLIELNRGNFRVQQAVETVREESMKQHASFMGAAFQSRKELKGAE